MVVKDSLRDKLNRISSIQEQNINVQFKAEFSILLHCKTFFFSLSDDVAQDGWLSNATAEPNMYLEADFLLLGGS